MHGPADMAAKVSSPFWAPVPQLTGAPFNEPGCQSLIRTSAGSPGPPGSSGSSSLASTSMVRPWTPPLASSMVAAV